MNESHLYNANALPPQLTRRKGRCGVTPLWQILSVSPERTRNTHCSRPAGFWPGFWHGVIAPIPFFVFLFADGVGIYETNNNGRWYDFGFVLVVGAFASHHEVRQATGLQAGTTSFPDSPETCIPRREP